MDGFSTAVAAVSLICHLIDTTRRISKFTKDVENAPVELVRLTETLDQFKAILVQVQGLLEQQTLVLRVPGSFQYICDALKSCERKLGPLERFSNNLQLLASDKRPLQKTWASLKFVRNKDRIVELHSQLRDAKLDLQLALVNNLSQLE